MSSLHISWSFSSFWAATAKSNMDQMPAWYCNCKTWNALLQIVPNFLFWFLNAVAVTTSKPLTSRDFVIDGKLKKLNTHLRSKKKSMLRLQPVWLVFFSCVRFSWRWWNYSRSSFPTIDVTFASWDQGEITNLSIKTACLLVLLLLLHRSSSQARPKLDLFFRGEVEGLLDSNSWESFAKTEDAIFSFLPSWVHCTVPSFF